MNTHSEIHNAVRARLEGLNTENGAPLIACISGITLRGDTLGFILETTAEEAPLLEATCQRALAPLAKTITIICTQHATEPTVTRPPPARPANYNATPLPHVGRIIAIASGKGGVGKSSLTVLLAHALAAAGHSVGIVDADIHGPSIPRMLGLVPTPPTVRDGLMIPAFAHGIMANSIGLIAGKSAAIWRGPMVSKALTQLLRGTNWHPQFSSVHDEKSHVKHDQILEVPTRKQRSVAALHDCSVHRNDDADGHVSHGETILLIDLPPGTGDIQLSLMQAVPVSAAIIITTPQEIARIDAHKAATMFQKLNIPILGIVENMSYLETPEGTRLTPFGMGGGQQLADSFSVPLLAQLPLDPALGLALDNGQKPPHSLCEAVSKLLQKINY